jgi:hypothetical protein
MAEHQLINNMADRCNRMIVVSRFEVYKSAIAKIIFRSVHYAHWYNELTDPNIKIIKRKIHYRQKTLQLLKKPEPIQFYNAHQV